MKAISRIVAAIILIIVVIIAAAGAWWFTRPPAPAPKPSITVGVWGGSWKAVTERLAADFTEETGIEVKLFVYPGASSLAEEVLDATWPEPTLDVAFTTYGVATRIARKGYSIELKEDEIPNMAPYPTPLKGGWGGKITYVGYYAYGNILGYREDYWPLDEPLTAFAQLWDPALAGSILVNYPTYLPGSFLIMAGLAFGGTVDDLDAAMDIGFEKVKELAEMGNIKIVYDTEATFYTAMGTTPPETVVGLSLTGNFYYLWKEAGVTDIVPVLTLTDTKTTVSVDVLQIIDTPNVEYSKQFLNWMLKPEVNADYCAEIGYLPAHPDAEADPEVAAWNLTPTQIEESGLVLDAIWIADNLDAWVEKWDTEVAPLIG